MNPGVRSRWEKINVLNTIRAEVWKGNLPVASMLLSHSHQPFNVGREKSCRSLRSGLHGEASVLFARRGCYLCEGWVHLYINLPEGADLSLVVMEPKGASPAKEGSS